jgi:hypothetical protein
VKTISALLMLVFAAAAHGQINKCVDKSGKVISYGNECPAGTTAADTGIRPTPGSGAPGSGAPASSTKAPAAPNAKKSLAEQNADFKKREADRQELLAQEQKKAGEDALRIRACEDSRAYLKSLQAGNRITRTDPKTGERIVLEDAGYPKEIAAAQQSVTANCK